MTAAKAIPANYPRITPYLCVHAAEEAIDFYRSVFGATERMRIAAPDGKIGHAELAIGDGLVMVSDEYAEMNVLCPKSIGGTAVTLSIYVDDVDDTFARAVAAGAKPLRPVEDQFYGDRSGQFEDPYGHRWSVATHIEDVSPDEMERRAAELFGA